MTHDEEESTWGEPQKRGPYFRRFWDMPSRQRAVRFLSASRMQQNPLRFGLRQFAGSFPGKKSLGPLWWNELLPALRRRAPPWGEREFKSRFIVRVYRESAPESFVKTASVEREAPPLTIELEKAPSSKMSLPQKQIEYREIKEEAPPPPKREIRKKAPSSKTTAPPQKRSRPPLQIELEKAPSSKMSLPQKQIEHREIKEEAPPPKREIRKKAPSSKTTTPPKKRSG